MLQTILPEDEFIQDRERESYLENLFREIKKEFRGRPDELIPLLQRAQASLGYLPEKALLEIARFTRLPAAKVFGTATFYTQFHLQPVGKNVIRICRGTACHVKGGARILKEVERLLGIRCGQSTPDLKFNLETVACIGACALAPTMMINHHTYGQLTSKKVEEILFKL